MRTGILFFALSISLLLSCCKTVDPPPTPPATNGYLRISYIANFDGQPFALDSLFTSAFNYRIKTETMKFLVHHIYVKNGSDSAEVRQHMIVDYENSSNSFIVSLEPGSYSGIKFGMGVDGSLNHSDPSALPSTHAFSLNNANDMFWTWSSGYIFTKFEGRADTTGTLSGGLDQLFFFHTGADTLYREIDLSYPFSISTGNTTNLYIDLDVNKLLVGINDTLDLKIDNATHTANNLPLASRFVALAKNAFTLHQ